MRLYGIGKAIYFYEVFQCYAFHQGSLPFSEVALLNWFTKSSSFEEGFNDNELL